MAGKLTLKAQEHRRIAGGHAWVFSNEIAEVEGADQPGDPVRVFSRKGDLLGSAYYNPHTLVAARLYARADKPLDAAFLRARLTEALLLRRKLYPARQAFRLVHSEGDSLPGLIVDVYGDVAVVQILTAGMERVREAILAELGALLAPRAIHERSDAAYRALEGLAPSEGPRFGEEPAPFQIIESDVRMGVDVTRGQKTGWFLDQFENRRRLRAMLPPGGRVLDCFCYVGGWALTALAAGANEAVGIDSSAWAIEQAEANAALNGWWERCRWVRGDVLERLHAWADAATGERFDLIVLDPPAFAKSKKHLATAVRAYRTINEAALRLLNPGGWLATLSCSHHVDPDLFRSIVAEAGARARRRLRVLTRLEQPADHPAVPAMPETTYLKGLLLQIEPY